MYNINAEILKRQAKHIIKRNFYLRVTLNDDVVIKSLQKQTKTVHSVNGWEFEEAAKAKWYSRVFTKPVQNYKAFLEVYDNGLLFYALYNSSNSKESCTARTISNIFQVAITECYVNGKGIQEGQYNGVLTKVLVDLNKKVKEA